MNALSVKLPAKMHAALADEARRRNVTRSALVRHIIGEALDSDPGAASPSCIQLAGDLIGSFRSGRRDLATNKRLLDEAVTGDADV